MVDKMIYSVIFYLGNTNPGVAQLVACLTGGQEAAGSSPVTRTIKKPSFQIERWFFAIFSYI